jgi:hypothetical protein
MRVFTESQRAAVSARKKEHYLNVIKPRIAELRAARIEGRTPLIILTKQPNKPRDPRELRDMRFEERAQPLPAFPPIRTTWQPMHMELSQ